MISSHFNVSLRKVHVFSGFHAFLRVGEITISDTSGIINVLQLRDIHFNSHAKRLTGMHYYYKHSDKRPFTVDVPVSSAVTCCQVVALQYYLSLSKRSPGPLFLFGDGLPITYAFFYDKVHSIMRFIGLDSSRIKPFLSTRSSEFSVCNGRV